MPTVADRTPFAVLLPPQGWSMEPELFEAQTERNEGFDGAIAWPGAASVANYEIPPTGVVASLRFLVQGTVTTTRSTGTITMTDAWPHGLLSRFVLRLNGQATPWNARGQDLQVLRQMRYRTITESFVASNVTTGGTGGTDTLRVSYEIPLALDPGAEPNFGGLFAQSVNSQILAEITTAAYADIVTLTGDGTFVINPTTVIRPHRTWYSVPVGRMKSGEQGMILPDLTTLHGLISQEVPITATGELQMELNRIQGTVGRLWVRLKNGAAASINPVTSVDEWRFQYASNQRPRVYSPYNLGWENEGAYRGMLPYSAIAVVDAITENLRRDAVDVENLSNPIVVATINSGVTITQPARAIVTYEMLAPLA